jgi:amino acid adenylation domain-containing protein
MLFHAVDVPGSAAYVEQFQVRLSGNLDEPAFRKAWQRVIERHPALRTSFMWREIEHPVQIVQRAPELSWHIEDWRNREPESQQQAVARFLSNDRLGFDLESFPLIRFALFRTDNTEWTFVWTQHHLLADGWSTQLVWAEVREIYDSIVNQRSIELSKPRPFRDFVVWLEQQDSVAAETYWRQLLSGFRGKTRIQLGLPELSPAGDYIRREVRLSAGETANVSRQARAQRLTLNTICMGAWAIAVHRFSGEDDALFGFTTAGRPAELSGASEIVGSLSNTLPLRSRFDPNVHTGDWLAELQRQQTESRQLEYASLAEIHRWSEVAPHGPLFECLFVFQNYPVSDNPDRPFGAVCVKELQILENSSVPLVLLVVPGEELRIILIGDVERFDVADLDAILGYLQELIPAVGKEFDLPLGKLPMVPSSQQRKLVGPWSKTESTPPTDQTWLDLFAQQVNEHAHRVAVSCGDQQLTYQELDRLSNQIAGSLADAGAAVAICLQRSANMIAAIVGVLKAGAAYVPLDPGYPPRRLGAMISDSNISHVLVDSQTHDRITDSGLQLIRLDRDLEAHRPTAELLAASKPRPNDLAYVMFTSGTSGTPQGVPISHRNLLASTHARSQYYQTTVDAFLLLSSISFDSSVAGIFWTLGDGGLLVIPTEDEFADPVAVTQLARRNHISHLLCLPRVYRELVCFDAKAFEGLRVAIVAGEACGRDIVALHSESLPAAHLFNEYGPTEATVWSTVHRCDPADTADRVPIGKPIPGTSVFVLDDHLLPVPIGVAGELVVGGPGVASGYLRDRNARQDRFLTLPLLGDDQQPFYRTGDRVRFRADGTLEYLGRVDNQLKVRGHRVEPEEIEAVIAEFPGIIEAAVATGGQRLPRVHHPVAKNGPSWTTGQLLEGLNRLNPESAESLLREIEHRCERHELRRPGFDVELRVTDQDLVDPPREFQRRWLINQVLSETADDLEHIGSLAKRFVPGQQRPVSAFDISDAELDAQDIMEDWQTPLMRAMAGLVTESHGDVLEVGFGRGISATFIQEFGVRSHSIIESNGPCIDRHFVPWRQNFADRDIRLFHGRWQDLIDQLAVYDGVFFHAFPLNEREFLEHIGESVTYAEHFFETAANLLRDGGVFSYLTAEIDTVSRRHQRKLFRLFRKLSMTVMPLDVPRDTRDAWWADSMVVIRAEK